MNLKRLNASYGARMRTLRKNITHADLTEAVNNTAQAIAVGTLPAGAVVAGQSYRLTTNFTGGSVSSCGLELGYTADPDAVLASVSVLTGAASAFKKGTAGVLVKVEADTAIVATFTPDSGHALLALTAGDVDVEVYYYIPDAAN